MKNVCVIGLGDMGIGITLNLVKMDLTCLNAIFCQIGRKLIKNRGSIETSIATIDKFKTIFGEV
tara:strand:- start:297 stop:488 length:192 start_codon:yes stop_codon:yes gene_type:complete